MENEDVINRKLCKLSEGFLLAVGIIPAITLIGWIFDIEILKRLINSSVAMNPLAAMLLVLAAIGFRLIQHKGYSERKMLYSQIIAGILIVAGLYKLISLVFDFPFLLDQIFFKSELEEPMQHRKNEMDPVMAFVIMNIGISIIIFDRWLKAAENILFFNTLIAILCLYGYAYGTEYLIEIANLFPVSILSAFCILFLNLAALFARPNRGNMEILIGESPFQIVNIRLLAFFLPLIVGWAQLYGENNDIFSKEFGTSIFAIFSYGLTMYLTKKQSEVEHDLRLLKEEEEKIIKEDAKRLNSILNNIPSKIFIKDLQGKVLTVNQSFENFYGVNEKNAVGKNIEDVVEDEKLREVFLERDDVIETGETRRSEFSVRFEGKKHYFWNVTFPLKDIKEKMYAICSISTEITELKEKAKEINEQKTWLNNILDNLSEGIVVTNKEGKFLLFNQMAERILGKSPSAVMPENLSEKFFFFDKDKLSPYPSDKFPLNRSLLGEKVNEEELLVDNPEFDKPKQISVTSRPMDIEGEEPQAVMVLRDVTEKREIQKEIKENARKLKTILLSIEEGIIVLDDIGKPFIFNDKAREILGIKPREIPWEKIPEELHLYKTDGKTLFDIKDLPIYKALKEKISDESIVVVKRPDVAKSKTIKVAATPVKLEDESINAVVVLTDISQFDYPDI